MNLHSKFYKTTKKHKNDKKTCMQVEKTVVEKIQKLASKFENFSSLFFPSYHFHTFFSSFPSLYRFPYFLIKLTLLLRKKIENFYELITHAFLKAFCANSKV